MKTTPAQLPQSLKKGLAPVYLISGDEPLLVQECCDQIRKVARDQGFADRLTFHADNHFDWNIVADEFSAMSLFAEKRRIEVHLPTGKLGDGRAVMERILAQPADDIVLLLISARLDAAETRRKWYKDLQGKGLHVPVWPVDADKFPGWLQQRAASRGLTLTRDALAILAERLEGNLLAASQELERLELFSKGATIDEGLVEQAVQDSSRFNGFELVSELLTGNASHACKMIGILQQEGENPLGLLTVLTRDIHLLLELKAPGQNTAPAAFFKKRGVFQPQRAKALEQAAKRLNRSQLNNAIHLCSEVDRAAKGFDPLGPWHYLRDMSALLASRS
ncbi:DNA polymerase III subunit delta [Marinobacter sp. M3C]|jgi:DNA polymerase-3 subunit delta|uniref:DNA polymerase III subunit delta n=1 Tax=unclassified Marinobacter TaxID=83889 RepID=UPI00200D638B|nr:MULTISPECIES: DNA polymerase III subunit delta [unclassified Marinobacter]MCL1477518.1 DNA polymerase III subunit delta [Marinobacter sp.]MCL1481624.1 DNA polymerase III subunit delta [Marinobacter sp.]MCL1483367.1 DNA polymerase III subunit delta [Marinobacter sp.]MCL1487030.1 DNA polymerase III subunit delta [Marinobacter sp.]UQG54708.1 DNA polymerase III subunit delta [Marinobacter sp. M4C]